MRAALGPAPDVNVRAAMVCGPPAQVMVGQCADADLLVLGGRHADTPLGQTVGAVAATCLRQAPCPVVIVTVAAASTGQVENPATDVALAPARHDMPGLYPALESG
jgi:hypothetical protein